MPSYDYRCESCEKIWDDYKTVSTRDAPCKEKCPHCKKKKVVRHIGEFPSTATDSTLTADKKTGGQWNDLMHKMKSYTPGRFHDKLDKASSQTGKRWKG
jgi:putative FmdB family regulatory protein